MPDLTTKLGLKKPLGNETVSRLSYNENLDLIDVNVALQTDLDDHKNAVDPHPQYKKNTDAPINHASSHAGGGTDPITPGSIGAETPSGAQAKADTAETDAINWAKGYGLGSVAKIITDWNNAVDGGFYMGTSVLNRPPAFTGQHGWDYGMVIKHNASYVFQMVQDFNQKGWFFRSLFNGSWTSWQKLWGENNLPISNLATIEQLNRNAYDDYLVWLELYYKGVLSQIDTVDIKAMIFDGFMDKENTDTVSTTAYVDTENQSTKATTNIYVPINNNSAYQIYGTRLASQTFILRETSRPLYKIDLPCYKIGNFTDSITLEICTTLDGKPTTTVLASTVIPNSSLPPTILMTLPVTFSSPPTLSKDVQYSFVLRATNSGGNSTDRFDVYNAGISYIDGSRVTNTSGTWIIESGDLGFNLYFEAINSVLFNKTKTLSFLPTKAKLYISLKKPAGTNAIPTITVDGTNYEFMILNGTRSDPKFAGYTEYEYEVTFANTGTTAKLKVDLTTTDPLVTAEIKRYGLYFY